jgi:transcriptional regulator with XRE-family HTH domain
MATVNTEMVILARESRGLSYTALTRLTGITSDRLRQYETHGRNGMWVEMSDEHLKLIAWATEYPESFFGRAERRYGFGTGCKKYTR